MPPPQLAYQEVCGQAGVTGCNKQEWTGSGEMGLNGPSKGIRPFRAPQSHSLLPSRPPTAPRSCPAGSPGLHHPFLPGTGSCSVLHSGSPSDWTSLGTLALAQPPPSSPMPDPLLLSCPITQFSCRTSSSHYCAVWKRLCPSGLAWETSPLNLLPAPDSSPRPASLSSPAPQSIPSQSPAWHLISLH